MEDQRIKHQEEMVGAGHPTKPDTLNRFMLVEHENTGKHKGGFFLMQVTETHIQWKHLYDEDWQDIIALADLTGAQGDPGNEVSLQTSATHIQWKLGDGEWENLIALADLTGAQGDPGTPAENISLQTSATHVQWKLGDGEWANLIALADLVGAQGSPGTPGAAGTDGDDGEEVSLQKSATHVQWKLGDGEWTNLVALADLKGDPGDLELGETSATAYRGDRGKTAYDHSQAAHAPSDATKNEKAAAADINTGTDDAKFATPKAIADSDILRTGVTGQVAGLTEKETVHDNDLVLIEDSEALNAKKKVKMSNMKGSGGGTFPSIANGSSETIGDYKVVTFSGSTTVQITQGGLFDWILVGGGGGGGACGGTGSALSKGGGGGGGWIEERTNFYIPAGNYALTIGAGGAGGSSCSNGSNGSYSSIFSLLAHGGGGGGAGNNNGYGSATGGGSGSQNTTIVGGTGFMPKVTIGSNGAMGFNANNYQEARGGAGSSFESNNQWFGMYGGAGRLIFNLNKLGGGGSGGFGNNAGVTEENMVNTTSGGGGVGGWNRNNGGNANGSTGGGGGGAASNNTSNMNGGSGAGGVFIIIYRYQ